MICIMPALSDLFMTRRFYMNVFLSLGALFSCVLLWRFVINFSVEKPADPHTPDAFVHRITVTAMNAQGKPAYQFSSPMMQHYAENDRTAFNLPYLRIYETHAPAWQISAGQGEARQGDQTIRLFHQVFLRQPKGADNPQRQMQTDNLVIYPQKKIMLTSENMTAFQPSLRLNSKGMKLDLINNTIKLLSDVHAAYQPLNKPPIYISAQTADFNQSQCQGNFEGKVILKQGNHILSTPKLRFYIDKKTHQLLKAAANGKLTSLRTLADPKNPPFLASADEMQYLPAQGLIRLLGHAKAQQGFNRYQAPEIDYYIETEKVVSRQGRMTLIILPSVFKIKDKNKAGA